MRNETEVLRRRVIQEGIEAGRPIWIRGRRTGSWAFVCNVCGEISYFPQNTRTKRPEVDPKVVMGYRYCPYCRTEMEGIATIRAPVGAYGGRQPDDEEEKRQR